MCGLVYWCSGSVLCLCLCPLQLISAPMEQFVNVNGFITALSPVRSGFSHYASRWCGIKKKKNKFLTQSQRGKHWHSLSIAWGGQHSASPLGMLTAGSRGPPVNDSVLPSLASFLIPTDQISPLCHSLSSDLWEP